jgi:hypothetical protein
MSASTPSVAEGKFTSEMRVANTGFLIDRMGKDCHPLQFLRELTQNSIEAICEMKVEGQIVWDVDWNNFDLTRQFKLSCIDTGVGMTGPEMVTYINQLSISTREQAHDKNFGIGAKVAAATRNHAGLLYLSWKNGEGAMIHLWRDPSTEQYGIKRTVRSDGSFVDWVRISDDVKPSIIDRHGTMVVLLGDDLEQDTMTPPEGAASPSLWVARYLNTRYFRFPSCVAVKARQGWKEPRSNTNVNVLRTITGQEAYLEQHQQAKGSVALTGATAHWWILRDEPAMSQNSGLIASSGHMAALYQDELYEMVTGRAGVARLQMFGIIFGHNRVVIYVEADAEHLTSSAARTHLLLGGEPLPWAEWASEFRGDRMPQEIRDLMEEVTAGASTEDHKQAIKERLRQVRDLFRISRYRPAAKGEVTASTEVVGGKAREGESEHPRSRDGSSSSGYGGRAGAVYALFIDEGGEAADELLTENDPEVKWISIKDGTRTPDLLEDRAAKYLPDQNILQINADFRVFTDMAERWCKRYGDVPGAREVVDENVREWFEQALVETVLGAQSLKDSPQWTMEDTAKLWSEEALTSAALQRYHIDVALRRALGSKLGSLKDATAA